MGEKIWDGPNARAARDTEGLERACAMRDKLKAAMTRDPQTAAHPLVERLRAASHDERLSTGALYAEAADALTEQAGDIERLTREREQAVEAYKLVREWLTNAERVNDERETENERLTARMAEYEQHQKGRRDRFAMAALTGLLANGAIPKNHEDQKLVAWGAAQLADSLIAELDKP